MFWFLTIPSCDFGIGCLRFVRERFSQAAKQGIQEVALALFPPAVERRDEEGPASQGDSCGDRSGDNHVESVLVLHVCQLVAQNPFYLILVKMFSRPVWTQMAARLGLLPIANALGALFSTMYILGFGVPALLASDSTIQ